MISAVRGARRGLAGVWSSNLVGLSVGAPGSGGGG